MTSEQIQGRLRLARSIQQSMRAAGHDVPLELILETIARVLAETIGR
jgi:hypothetical protein